MPRLPKDYKKSLIYKLCCNDTNIKEEYVGSTTDFTRRKYCHKIVCNNPNSKNYNLKVYQFIRQNNGWDNWSMILVENFPCENELQLKQRERHFIETLESKLNSSIPTRTKKEYNKEYYVENIDKLKEYNKEYRVENIDKLKEYHKEYRDENIDKLKAYIKEYTINNKDNKKEYNKEYQLKNTDKIKACKKEYYVENIDKLKAYKKEYYVENIDKLKEYNKEKITCECGVLVRRYSLPRHRKSKKHLKLLQQKKEEKKK
jgi:hypothetical protein